MWQVNNLKGTNDILAEVNSLSKKWSLKCHKKSQTEENIVKFQVQFQCLKSDQMGHGPCSKLLIGLTGKVSIANFPFGIR